MAACCLAADCNVLLALVVVVQFALERAAIADRARVGVAWGGKAWALILLLSPILSTFALFSFPVYTEVLLSQGWVSALEAVKHGFFAMSGCGESGPAHVVGGDPVPVGLPPLAYSTGLALSSLSRLKLIGLTRRTISLIVLVVLASPFCFLFIVGSLAVAMCLRLYVHLESRVLSGKSADENHGSEASPGRER